MESPFELMRRYWNPAAVLDALDIKAWPPSVDEVGESFYEGQHRPRDDAPSVTPRTRSAETGFIRRQQPPRRGPASPTRPWLSPRDAALRIQSAYRGHRVRDGVRRVVELEAEVEAVETRIMASLDQILGDDRERARVNEMIMDVLVRLDGVRGCCRDYRKRVIKKAISLQEALDCLVGGDGRGGGAADLTHPKQLGRESNNQGIEEQVGERADDDDDDRIQGNSSHDDDDDDDDDEEEEEEEEEERSRSSSGCGSVKEALVRVTEENTALRSFVRGLLERNEQQAAVMQQLTERIDYLERKLQRLGRKRRRSRHGEGGGGGGAATAASFSSSSSSAGEGDPDREEVCSCGDGQRMIDHRDGGCEQQDDRRQG